MNSRRVMLVVSGVLTLLTVTGQAQDQAGEVYTAPRTSFGHPDLQGIWQVVNAAVWNIQDHTACLLYTSDAADDMQWC